MPFYAYLCSQGHAYDKLKPISDRKSDVCHECGSEAIQQITSPAPPIMRGQPGGTAKNLGPPTHRTGRVPSGVDTTKLPVVGMDGNLYSPGGTRLPNE
jgi:putative FmdB family regulatory protein